ncbi:VIT domain-containing protein [Blastopirellula marina]|uniref:Inter-alpha-trypsin inhibitor family heavy chain-related protein-hypothetical secreted or membrane-associated n=1 Tax=Blastopirellula marina DSM 3645 TaxID=314230 RepID=A3ZZ07_9BACT|nr:VIT domain-containing protein [Blastopirellula marina]EAQ78251.1 inter-alpha-trypsin inhibitor family heavy chain-related protein-hypothetical secreted or membrane-associated [Blastopirellula marina DSM 3645]
MSRYVRLSLWGPLALFFALFSGALGVSAQTVVIIHDPIRPIPLPRPIPRPSPQPVTESYKIKSLEVDANIEDQIAKVQVSQTFENTCSRQLQVSFLFPLPYDGAIDSLTLLVDGKEYPAKLLPKEKAREIYEEIVRKNQDPALLEWIGTGMFQTSVFPVPAGASRTVTITYSQLLRKDNRLTDFLFPLSTARFTDKPLEKLRLRVSVETKEKLKSVYSPTHEVEVKRKGKNRAVVTIEQKDCVPTNDFRLFFDTAKTDLSASVLTYRPDKSEDGYFLLLASPPVEEVGDVKTKKTVIFVVDRSGSMSGEKIEQAKEAAKFVLNNLNEGDLFNIIAYDSDVESFEPELQKLDDKTREKALGFVDNLYAGGSTNIDGALAKAMGMLKDDKRPSYMLFLTDGLPTHGEQNEAKIVDNAKQKNDVRARVISFGVGYDVNSRLLDRLSRECFGQSEYVRPNEDIETHVAKLYNKISAPVMTNVAIKYDLEKGGDNFVNRLQPKQSHDLFAGEQLIIAGRYRKHGDAKITIVGTVGDKKQKVTFPAEFVKESDDQTYAFVEKLWAMRRIGEIIDDIDLNGKNDELVKELVSLSTKHGIITPYTSFLADENSSVSDLADARRGGTRSFGLAEAETRKLSAAGGRLGFSQRAQKGAYQQADRANSGGFGGISKGNGINVARIEASSGFSPKTAAANAYAGGAVYQDVENDQMVVASNIRNIGNETLFLRDKIWIAESAGDIDPAKDQKDIKTVERYSKEYFELVAANNKQQNSLLAQQQPGEQLLCNLRGQYYLIK